MTDFTKTIVARVGIVGLGKATYWNSIVWGTDNWGESHLNFVVYKNHISTAVVTTTNGFSVIHQFPTTAIVTTVQAFHVQHQITDDLTIDSSKASNFQKSYGNNLDLTSDPNEINVCNNGYERVFHGGTTNALSAVANAYVLSSTTSIWSQVTAASTVWS